MKLLKGGFFMYNNFNSYYEDPYTYGDYYDDDFAEDVFAEDVFAEDDFGDGYYGEYVPTLCETCISAPIASPVDQTQGNSQNPQDNFENAPGSPIEQGTDYTQGYLRTLIGRRVKIEFILGTNMLIDREGTLLQVGISYVVIKEVDTGNEVMCDIYSIKFVNTFPQVPKPMANA
jgi:hypothetical protein